MNLILLGVVFVGGCFAGGFINHWLVSSGITKALSALEVKVGNLTASLNKRPLPLPLPAGQAPQTPTKA